MPGGRSCVGCGAVIVGGEDFGNRPGSLGSTVAAPARMYDYYLGGKDNFAADRQAAEKALSVVPLGRYLARANRNFVVRAVRMMAERGVSQFIDLGSGFPTHPNVHETARAADPAARVVYVDNDPVVLTHVNAVADRRNGVIGLAGDIRLPHAILANDQLWEHIDSTRPVGVLFAAVLHFVTDDHDPYGSVAAVMGQVPADSLLTVSHITSDGAAPSVIETIQDAYRAASAPAVFRTRAQIARFFAGLELIDPPGLADVFDWYAPGNARTRARRTLRFLAGVAAKP